MRVRIAAAAALLPAAAFARAGGGAHAGYGARYGSGSYSSHGSYSGHGYYSGSGVVFGLPGSIGFCLLVFFIVLVVYAMIFGKSSGHYAASVARRRQAEPPNTQLAALVARDPAFDIERFLSRAEMAFLLMRQAEIRNDADGGRAFVSPEFFAMWSPDIQARKTAHQNLILGGLNIRDARIVAVAQNAVRDVVRVMFDVVSSVFVVDEATERIVWGSTEERRQATIVTFERSLRAVTNVGGGAVERKCAACGAPLRLRDTGECSHCDAIVTNGAFDWVITNCESGSIGFAEFAAPDLAQKIAALGSVQTGVAEIRAHDPAFSMDEFRRRVATTFTAVQGAWSARNLERGRLYMSEGLYLAWSMQIEAMLNMHRSNMLENLRIELTEPVSAVRSAQLETITVSVTASAVDYEIDDRTGKIVFGDRRERRFVEEWVFQRTAGTTTVEHGLSESTCPACGAPLQLSEIGECTYCSAAVRSGKFDWVLTRILQVEDGAYVDA